MNITTRDRYCLNHKFLFVLLQHFIKLRAEAVQSFFSVCPSQQQACRPHKIVFYVLIPVLINRVCIVWCYNRKPLRRIYHLRPINLVANLKRAESSGEFRLFQKTFTVKYNAVNRRRVSPISYRHACDFDFHCVGFSHHHSRHLPVPLVFANRNPIFSRARQSSVFVLAAHAVASKYSCMFIRSSGSSVCWNIAVNSV